MSADPLLGQTLGGARLEQRVSKGLMADVYRGHYERLNVPVAVKVLSPKAMAQGVNKDRFIREGQALAKLQHPNIIKIYHVGHEQNRYFIIMDWIQDGMNLRQLGQSRPLTPPQSLKVIERLCEALTYCHERQLIHRDVKPANICLRRGGHPVLMDFSLLKDESSDVQLTAPGTIMGTVNFMPPEQAQPGGAFGDVGPRSDVYSLGGTLYWLLTGKPPFKGRTPMETIIKLMREDPIPAMQHNPSLPPIVNQLVMDCLSKQQDVRPSCPAELQQRIADLFTNHRAEIDATQRPAVADESGSGRQTPQTGRQQPATGRVQQAAGSGRQSSGSWGTASSTAVSAPVEARQGPLTQQQPASGAQPSGAGHAQRHPSGAHAQHPPSGTHAQRPPSGAHAQRPPSGAHAQHPGQLPPQQPPSGHQHPPSGHHAQAPQRPSGAAHAVQPPSGITPNFDEGFAPATSTEVAAAGMLKLPDEFAPPSPSPSPPSAESSAKRPMLLYAVLIAIIVISLGITAYVVLFELG